MSTPIKTVYADGVSRVQYSAGNIKITLYTSEDNRTADNPNIDTTPIMQLVMPAESTVKAITEMSKFINTLIEAKKIQPVEQE